MCRGTSGAAARGRARKTPNGSKRKAGGLDQMRGGAGRLPPQAAPKQPALSGSRYKPPPLVEVLTADNHHSLLVQPPLPKIYYVAIRLEGL